MRVLRISLQATTDCYVSKLLYLVTISIILTKSSPETEAHESALSNYKILP